MITKEEFNKLYDDNITKKEFDLIIKKIDARFNEIVNSMDIKGKNNKSWFDYDNCGDGADGYFDHILYKEEIGFCGEYLKIPDGLDGTIPTRWLWEENWKEDYKKMLENSRKLMEEYNNKIQYEKEKVLKIREIIKSKLTEEELKYIKWND